MQVRDDVAELLRDGLSNAEVSRRTGIHPVKVADARRALRLPDHRDMKPPSYIAPPSHRAHGERAKYTVEKCRCKRCKRANTEANNQRSRLLAYGQWEPFVDAEPVRAHIRYLQSCGMGLRSIAAVLGVDRKNLQSIVIGRPERGRGPQKQIRPERAAAVLAIEPTLDNLAANTLIDGTGTTRRLQALTAMGWPTIHLADEMQWTGTNTGALLTAPTVMVKTARLVRDVYGRLWNVDPLEHGASPGGITYAKRRAHDAGWAPVGAWDDESIDDPEAFPDWTGHCGTHRGYDIHRNKAIPMCQPCREAGAEYRHARNTARALSTLTV
ncbi:hypothetical protein ACWCQN_13115 [Streptomyces sp. NPDC001984]